MLKTLYQSTPGTTEPDYNLQVIAEAEEMTYRADALIVRLAEHLTLAKEALQKAQVENRIPEPDTDEVLAALGFLHDLREELETQAEAITYQKSKTA